MTDRRILPGHPVQSFGSLQKTTKVADTGKYIVASFSQNEGHSLSQRPYEHTSLREASQEAERLATMNKGTTYVVLEVKGSVTATGHVWS